METHTLTIKVETNYYDSEIFRGDVAHHPGGQATVSVDVYDASDAGGPAIWEGEMYPAWSYDSPSVAYFRSQAINADSLEVKWTATEELGDCPDWLRPYVEPQVLEEAENGIKTAVKKEDMTDPAAAEIINYRNKE